MFDPSGIDPALRLLTTRTAHSVLAESIMIESAQERRKRRRKELISTIKRKATMSGRGTGRAPSLIGSISGRTRASTIGDGDRSVASADFGSRSQTQEAPEAPPTVKPPTKSLSQRFHDILNNKSTQPAPRRMIYVNLPLPSNLLHKGEPIVRYVRNKVRTAKYTIITFLPRNLFEQFRRIANVYCKPFFELHVEIKLMASLGTGHPPAVPGLRCAKRADRNAPPDSYPRDDSHQGRHRRLAPGTAGRRGQQFGDDQTRRMAECQPTAGLALLL